MNLSEKNKTLFAQAKALKMCDEVHRTWYGKVLNDDSLYELYFQNYDFCSEYHWPTNNTIKEMFSADSLRAHNVLVDDEWSLLNPSRGVILGSSTAKVRFNAFAVGTIYVRDNSDVEVTAKGHAYVAVHVHESARVRVSAVDNARVTIFIHSKEAIIQSFGQTTIKECIGI